MSKPAWRDWTDEELGEARETIFRAYEAMNVLCEEYRDLPIDIEKARDTLASIVAYFAEIDRGRLAHWNLIARKSKA